MRSKTTKGFWEKFRGLPEAIQVLARAKYRIWLRRPFHPPLHFKQIRNDIWSIRVNQNYRAMARRKGDLIVWFWIGTHTEYDRLLK